MREQGNTNVRENQKVNEQHILQPENQSKKRLFRRLTLFLAFALIVIASLSITFYKQNMTIKEQVAGTTKLEGDMNSLKDEEKKLQEQIRQLNDDDYIAKIARRDYFFSKDGEITFPMTK